MPTFPIRFTLTAPGAPSHQNPARCAAVEAPSAKRALALLAAHYAARGRNPHIYAIAMEGRWRRVGRRAFRDGGRRGLAGVAPEILGDLANPAPMRVETPPWAIGAQGPAPRDKLARIATLAAELAPTPSGAEAERLLAGLHAAIAADPAHRLEGRFKKMKALARAEGLWRPER